jgi:homoserine O-acetyltransferase
MASSLATRYPERVELVIPIAAGVETTSLQILHNFEQTVAIENDPDFVGGDYYDGPPPERGLTLARMIGHKTFVSLRDLNFRARDEVVQPNDGPGTYQLTHALESYIWHQATKFVKRFDANTYLRIIRAWTAYDLAAEADVETLEDLFLRSKHHRYLLFSIDSDVCFYPEEQANAARILELADVPYRWITVHSDKGHDSFLLEPDLYAPHIRAMLNEEW